MGDVRGRHARRLAPAGDMLALSALLALAAGGSTGAQPVSAPAPSAAGPSSPAACELHIWPSQGAHTTFQGWIRAGQVDGARRGVKGYPDFHADALGAAEQARLLGGVDWRAAFNDPALVVVVHPAPTGSENDRTRAARLVGDGAAACYREVIIQSTIVESEVFASLSVRVLALRKRFDGEASGPLNFSSMSEAPILISEADKAAPDRGERMDAAVRAAFVLAVSKFATMQSFH